MTVLSPIFHFLLHPGRFPGQGNEGNGNFVREGNTLALFAGVHSTGPGISRGSINICGLITGCSYTGRSYMWNITQSQRRGITGSMLENLAVVETPVCFDSDILHRNTIFWCL